MPVFGNLGTIFVRDKDGNLVPVPVIRGEDGITPHIGENGNWFIGERDTGVSASGTGGVSFTPGNALELKNGVLNVVTTDTAEEDNTLPITSAGVNMIVGNIGALLDTI